MNESRQDTFLAKVKGYVEKQQLIRRGDLVLAGISGGADSIGLLFALHSMQELLGFELRAITVHHGIRGASAEADVELVAKYCRQLGIPLSIRRVEVPSYANAQGLSVEEAARTLRYECFSQLAEETGATRLAVAHHKDDQCETVLHHLFRGSSLRGLRGMLPERELDLCDDCTVIRPFLCVTKAEIEAWLQTLQVTWRVDETNFEETYTRNYLRHHLIPEIAAKVNTQAVEHITQTAEDMKEAQALIAAMAKAWISEYGKVNPKQQEAVTPTWNEIANQNRLEDHDNFIELPGELLMKQPGILRREILMQCLERISPETGCKDVGRVHLEQIEALCRGGHGRWISLPGRRMARYAYATLRLMPEATEPATIEEGNPASDCEHKMIKPNPCETVIVLSDLPGEKPIVLHIEKETLLNHLDFSLVRNNGQKDWVFDKDKTYTKYLNCDIIKDTLWVRTRRQGDYFLLESGGRKSLKSYLIDKKIPVEVRDSMPVLADGSHVWWIGDGRISAACKVKPETKCILVLKHSLEENNNERNNPRDDQ